LHSKRTWPSDRKPHDRPVANLVTRLADQMFTARAGGSMPRVHHQDLAIAAAPPARPAAGPTRSTASSPPCSSSQVP
jgi:hypothetical protein